jgi:hypothetical protein
VAASRVRSGASNASIARRLLESTILNTNTLSDTPRR